MVRGAILRRGGVRRRAVLLLAAGAAALLLAAAGRTGLAADTNVTGTASITGGDLTLTVPGSIAWTAQLTGYDQAVSTPVSIGVTDATGSGAGWNVTVKATTFATGGGLTLPADVLSVNGSAASKDAGTAPTAACAPGSTCALPANGTSYPVAVPASASPTPVKVASAAADTGLGAVDLASRFWLALPANVKAGTYTGSLTFGLNAGP